MENIQQIRAEIFRLAQSAPDLEVMHWYMWLDECFENDELQQEKYKSMAWRLSVLREKREAVGELTRLINAFCQEDVLSSEGSLYTYTGTAT